MTNCNMHCVHSVNALLLARRSAMHLLMCAIHSDFSVGDAA